MQKSESSVGFSLKVNKNTPKLTTKNKQKEIKDKVRHEISQAFH